MPVNAGRLLQPLLHVLLLRPLVKLLFGLGVEGRRHLRGLPQFIVVANHNSHLDMPVLFQLLPARQITRTHAVAAHEYFSRSRLVFRTVDFLFRPVWVVRRGGETAADAAAGAAGPSTSAAMAAMRDHLRAGHSLVVFPEGTRGRPGEIVPFRRGVGRLAVEFPEIPVVPVFLAGPERALPKASGVPVPLWNRVVVGPPQRFTHRGAVAPLEAEAAESAAARVTAELERQVRDLANLAMAGRHRRQERPVPAPIVAVLGIDGSGKSTLSRNLARRLSAGGRVALVSDEVAFFEDGAPLELRPLVSERARVALNRRTKTARSLKSYKIPKLAELLLRDRVVAQIRRWHRPVDIVLDGSPLLNLAAWARLYRAAEFDDEALAAALRLLTATGTAVRRDPLFQRFPELSALVRLHLTPLGMPDAVFFLDVEPSVCIERIRSRGEARQVHETEEKLAGLRQGYHAVCRVLEPALGVRARVLDGRRTPDELAAEALGELDRMLARRPEGPVAAASGGPPEERRATDA